VICPFCYHENIDGISECDNCLQDLASLDRPEGRSEIERRIMRAPLSKIAPHDPVFVARDATLAEAASMLCKSNLGCVLVGDAERLEGILSERDVLLRAAHRLDEAVAGPVSDYMTRKPACLDVDAPIAYGLNRMATGDFRHLPLVRDGVVVGIISMRDVLGFVGKWYPDLFPDAEE